MRTLWTALMGVSLLVGCNTVSGVKEDSRQAADYTYEKKEEYQRKLASEMRELDVKIDELKAKAGRASDSVKAEFAPVAPAVQPAGAVAAPSTTAAARPASTSGKAAPAPRVAAAAEGVSLTRRLE